MKARLALVAGLAGLTALVAPAGAAPAEPLIVDQKGDANATSAEGNADGTATPGSQDGMDILSANFSTQKDKSGQPAVLVVDLDLAAPPAGPSIFRVTAYSPDCETLFFQYQILPDAAPSATFRYCDPAGTQLGPSSSMEVKDFQIFEGKMRWSIPLSVLSKLPPKLKAGTTLTNLGAHVRLFAGTTTTGGATVPTMDNATTEKSYKIA